MIDVKVNRASKVYNSRIWDFKFRPNNSGHTKIKVGFPKENEMHKSSGKLDPKHSMLDRAIVNNYGFGNVPARPFMDISKRKHGSDWQAFMKLAGTKILKNEINMATALGKLGAKVQGHIQQEITDLKTPPNSEQTVERKGSSNPLIDTGDMRKAVSWVTHD